MYEKIKAFGEKYGWGAVISGAPYANWLAVLTAGLACYILYVVFSMFGIYPAPPSESGNPISWLLCLMFQLVFGWFMWTYMVTFPLFLIGAAWSVADLLYAHYTKTEDRYRGAVAGLCMTLVPISLWYRHQPETDAAFAQAVSVASHFINHIH